MSGPAIELTDIRRTYAATRPSRRARRRGVVAEGPRVALEGLSLAVPGGQWLALLGPNGSGKSTLMRILATLDAPDAGRVGVLGHDAAASPAAVRARLGVVFQSPGLDPLLTVRENLLGQAALFGIPRGDAAARAERAARAFGVDDRLDDRVGRLSGGLARRADLARALLPEPDVLLLDEPTGGLDHEARAAFLALIELRRAEAASADRPLTIVMSTHMMDEAERADRVVLLDRGRIVGDGPPDELRRSLGGAVVAAPPAHEPILRAAGLAVTLVGADAVGAGEPHQVEAAASALARAGAAFRVGPPTLGDVYLARTGRGLHGDDHA